MKKKGGPKQQSSRREGVRPSAPAQQHREREQRPSSVVEDRESAPISFSRAAADFLDAIPASNWFGKPGEVRFIATTLQASAEYTGASFQEQDYLKLEGEMLDTEAILATAQMAVDRMNPSYQLTVNSEGGFHAHEHGEVVVSERNRHFVIDNKEAVQEHPYFDHILDTIQQQLGQIRQSDDAKVLVQGDGHLCVVTIDAGSHKERIAFTDGGSYLYSHMPSSYEREQRKPLRSRYIQAALRRGVSPRFSTAHNSEYGVTAVGKLAAQRPSEVLRLAFSVKDLDLNLGSDEQRRAANHFFEKGAVNMSDMVMFASAEPIRVPDGYLPAHETQMLQDIARAREGLESFKEGMRTSMESLERAKDLNYEILSDLRNLQIAVEQAQEFGGQRKGQTELYQQVIDISEKLNQMTEAMAAGGTQMYIPLNFFTKLVEPYAHLADSISMPPDGFDLAGAVKKFNGFFADNMGTHVSRDRVKSAQDAVRYLHALMYESRLYGTDEYSKLAAGGQRIDPFWPTVPRGSMGVLDLTTEGAQRSVPGKIFFDTFAGLSRQIRKEAEPDGNEQRFPVVVIGDHRLEMVFSAGHHHVEITADWRDADKGYAMVFRWAQKPYKEADKRELFVREILEDLGFVHPEDQPGLMNHEYRVSDSKEWAHALSEVIRLAYGMKDLDMYSWGSADFLIDMFNKGVTNVSYLSGDFFAIAYPEDTSTTPIEAVGRLLRDCSEAEEMAMVHYVAESIADDVIEASDADAIINEYGLEILDIAEVLVDLGTATPEVRALIDKIKGATGIEVEPGE